MSQQPVLIRWLGRSLPWVLLVVSAVGTYTLLGVLGALHPSGRGQVIAAAVAAAEASPQAAARSAWLRPTGLSAAAEDAAKQAAGPAEHAATF